MKRFPFIKGCATLFSVFLLVTALSGCGTRSAYESGLGAAEMPTITNTSVPTTTQTPAPTATNTPTTSADIADDFDSNALILLGEDDYETRLADAIKVLETSLPETENKPAHASGSRQNIMISISRQTSMYFLSSSHKRFTSRMPIFILTIIAKPTLRHLRNLLQIWQQM